MTQDTKLDIRKDQREDAEILHVRGELDLTNADSLRAAIAESRARKVILELSLVTFVDSAGIHMIDLAHGALGGSDRLLLVVARPESRAAWTFRVAGFGDGIVHASIEAALLASSRS